MGPAENVIAEYLSSGAEVEGERRWDDADEAPGNDTIRLRSVRVLNTNGEVSSVLDNRQPFCVEFEYDVHRPAPGLRVGFWIVTSDGIIVLSTDDAETPDYEEQRIAPGRYVSSCKIPGSLLNSGTYVITIASLTPHVETYFFEESVLQFQIHFVGSLPGRTADRPPGIIYSNFPWRISGNGQWVMRDEG
jgi:lipopolysaccharide transport system ATP-binding protein